MLPRLHKSRNIALVAVDEAHCVSLLSKGRNKGLRPAYHDLGGLRRVLPTVPILALTAVANDFVKQDIVDMLNLKYLTLIQILKMLFFFFFLLFSRLYADQTWSIGLQL